MKNIISVNILLVLFFFGCTQTEEEAIKQEPNGISISPWEVPVSLKSQDTLQFMAYHKPDFEEATDMIWTVESPNDAITVDESTGLVHTQNDGWAMLVARSATSPISDTSYVVVSNKLASVDFIEPVEVEVEGVIGQTKQVYAFTTPYNVSDMGLIWYEADEPEKITVTRDGKVTPKVPGLTYVLAHTIRTEDRERISTAIRFDVQPTIAVEEIVFAEEQFEKTVTEVFDLDFSVLPENANDTIFTYHVADTTVIGIHPETGQLVGKKLGSTYVFVSNGQMHSDPIKVIVEEPILAEGVTLTNPHGPIQFIGQTVKLVPEFRPEDTFDKTGAWTSSDQSILMVDQEGNVTSVSDGVANVHFVSNDGGFESDIDVEVKTRLDYIIDGNINPEIITEMQNFRTSTSIAITSDRNGNDKEMLKVVKNGAHESKQILFLNGNIHKDYQLEYSVWVKLETPEIELEKYDIALRITNNAENIRYDKVIPVDNSVYEKWVQYTFNFDDVLFDPQDFGRIELIFQYGDQRDEGIGKVYYVDEFKGPGLDQD
ncbi:Ig-like domain-containing protein [Flammeovirga yaeyamensis]|uniref:Ig-like domain-containing protein n=1 Tax=Flammeovirga yaeyamensis TaxID=367791 RepID=A0AAX1NFA4_9BACT|nr:Ig-like domain-containing protein [Flammeovirga yaeyamensis]MBB3696515.1 uncharacterized protein YjdB [Flammeovirga yaeyamensis]NMF33195.1 Ig-like domain-containing protein [Flammeovirga yaeyamensis]QWG05525.1 Ig-like domain-containing protein [Flammeovirga yaeyamensis]